MSECTSTVSAALHTPGRCVLAFNTISCACSQSALASTYTWQLPDAAYMTGTAATPCRASFRRSPPRGMIRSTEAPCVASSASSSRPPPASRLTLRSGRPACTAPSWAMRYSAALEWLALEEPRSTIALPDFRHSAVASIATLGRASYTTATTPSGTRTLRTSRPLGRRQPSITSPTGSASAAIWRTACAIARTRASSRRRRSSSAAPISASLPACMSCSFASSTSCMRASSPAAIASSAPSLTAVSVCARTLAARFAARHTSATGESTVAMALKGTTVSRPRGSRGAPPPRSRAAGSRAPPRTSCR